MKVAAVGTMSFRIVAANDVVFDAPEEEEDDDDIESLLMLEAVMFVFSLSLFQFVYRFIMEVMNVLSF